MMSDINDRKQAEKTLKKAHEECRIHAQETTALLKAARSVLESRDFESAAKEILLQCKATIDAQSGYIALLRQDGSEKKVFLLNESGHFSAIDPDLLAPLRGMLEEAYRSEQPIYRNDFSESKGLRLLSEALAIGENQILAPFAIVGKVVGVVGLAGKSGGFNDEDAYLVYRFGEIAALALHDSINREALENSETRFRSIVQTSSDAIISINQEGEVVLWNRGAENIFNYTFTEMAGRDLSIIMPRKYIKPHREALRNAVKTGLKHSGKKLELSGLKKDGSEFPIELTVTKWLTNEGAFFASIIRDITDRKRAEAELVAAHDNLDRLVTLRTAKLAETNTQLLAEIEERKKCDIARNAAESALAMESQQLAETNTALRVLLQHREEDLKETEQKIVANIQELVFPYVEALRQLRLSPNQLDCLNIIDANLQMVINPFLQNLNAHFRVFTPREIQIANMIKEGKTGKDIAKFFNIAPRSIEFYRTNIRKKLGLRGKKTSLRTFLLTLSEK